MLGWRVAVHSVKFYPGEHTSAPLTDQRGRMGVNALKGEGGSVELQWEEAIQSIMAVPNAQH